MIFFFRHDLSTFTGREKVLCFSTLDKKIDYKKPVACVAGVERGRGRGRGWGKREVLFSLPLSLPFLRLPHRLETGHVFVIT